MKQNLMFVENENGRQFAAKLIAKGDRYGLEKCLAWESDKLGIEFYDVKYAGDGFDELGQFVSRYYVETLLDDYPNNGLCLDGGVPVWTIDGAAMRKLYFWLKEKETEFFVRQEGL